MRIFKRKFPHYTQLNSSDCGPTCLRMIASYYGKEYSAETLRKHSFISREGVSMLGICDAAEYIGMRTLGMKLTFEQLVNEVNFPCILHWNQNHFVVCYGVHHQHRTGNYILHIADPASQCLTYNEREFKRAWLHGTFDGEPCGIVLLLEPGGEFGMQDDDSVVQTRHRNFRIFSQYYMPYRKMLIQLVAGMIVGVGMQFIFPFLAQAMVDIGIGHQDLGFVTLILLAQVVLFLTQLSVGFIRSWVLLHVNARVDIALISNFLLKLTCLPLNFFDTRKLGDTLQRIDDHDRIKNLLMGNSLNMLFSVFSFLIFSVVLAYYDWRIFLIFIVGNTCCLIWASSFLRYRRELDSKRFGIEILGQQNNGRTHDECAHCFVGEMVFG